MRNRIIEYKIKLEELKESKSLIDKPIVSKLLIMINIAELAIISKAKIKKKQGIDWAFNAQSSIGRYFCDWYLDCVPEYYFEITQYLKRMICMKIHSY
jgi:hypothetical protein